jgi:hypothetical protein
MALAKSQPGQAMLIELNRIQRKKWSENFPQIIQPAPAYQ